MPILYAAIDKRAGAETRLAFQQLEAQNRSLRAQVRNLVNAGSALGIPHLGEFTTAPDTPSYPATYALSYKSADADFGDEYWISGRKANGKWTWKRFMQVV